MILKMESSEKEFQQLVEQKQREIQLRVDKKIHKIKMWYVTVELIVSILGYGIIIYNFGFLLALGVWLAIWGNNMGFLRSISKRGNILKELWK